MIIDSHTHMPGINTAKKTDFFQDTAAAVEYLRQAGVDAAVFNTYQGVFSRFESDIDEANAQALELFEKFNGFLYPGAVIHPAFYDRSIYWLHKFRDRGLMWVGELVSYKCNIEFDHRSWMRLFEHCALHKHAVQLHNTQSVNDVALAFPQLMLIISHLNIATAPGVAHLELQAENPNTYLDVSGMYGALTIGGIERALEIFGEDRLLFGSDFIGYEPRASIARVAAAVPDKRIREKIYHKNIIRLLEQINSLPIV